MPQITISRGKKPGENDLVKSMRCLIDLIEKGCYPGEDTEMAEIIVVRLMEIFKVEPFKIKYEMKKETAWGHKI